MGVPTTCPSLPSTRLGLDPAAPGPAPEPERRTHHSLYRGEAEAQGAGGRGGLSTARHTKPDRASKRTQARGPSAAPGYTEQSPGAWRALCSPSLLLASSAPRPAIAGKGVGVLANSRPTNSVQHRRTSEPCLAMTLPGALREPCPSWVPASASVDGEAGCGISPRAAAPHFLRARLCPRGGSSQGWLMHSALGPNDSPLRRMPLLFLLQVGKPRHKRLTSLIQDHGAGSGGVRLRAPAPRSPLPGVCWQRRARGSFLETDFTPQCPSRLVSKPTSGLIQSCACSFMSFWYCALRQPPRKPRSAREGPTQQTLHPGNGLSTRGSLPVSSCC